MSIGVKAPAPPSLAIFSIPTAEGRFAGIAVNELGVTCNDNKGIKQRTVKKDAEQRATIGLFVIMEIPLWRVNCQFLPTLKEVGVR